MNLLSVLSFRDGRESNPYIEGHVLYLVPLMALKRDRYQGVGCGRHRVSYTGRISVLEYGRVTRRYFFTCRYCRCPSPHELNESSDVIHDSFTAILTHVPYFMTHDLLRTGNIGTTRPGWGS